MEKFDTATTARGSVDLRPRARRPPHLEPQQLPGALPGQPGTSAGPGAPGVGTLPHEPQPAHRRRRQARRPDGRSRTRPAIGGLGDPHPRTSGPCSHRQKSTYSGDGINCVDTARTGTVVRILDSKNPDAGHSAVAPSAWGPFLTYAAGAASRNRPRT
ncbi:DUF397 domain-containing protein [Streptomyces sp. NPDC006610]|uniref:DUF397 domain-containing protein n=1 Tax=Streptomyces sp. NPDC006610 TaxID=3154584 RepID=UPI0033B589FF